MTTAARGKAEERDGDEPEDGFGGAEQRIWARTRSQRGMAANGAGVSQILECCRQADLANRPQVWPTLPHIAARREPATGKIVATREERDG